MSVRTKDLSGKRFGRLKVLRDSGCRQSTGRATRALWDCECDCGNRIKVNTSNLTKGTTKSCGCLAKESAREMIARNSNIYFEPEKFKEVRKRATKSYTEKYVKENTNIKNLDMALPSHNTSGYKGVSWDKSRSRWLARIKFQKKNIHLGRYKDIKDAIKARREAEEKYFKPVLEKYKNNEVTK